MVGEKNVILGKLIYHLEQLSLELNKTLQDLKEESKLPEAEAVDMDDFSYLNFSSEMIEHYQSLLSFSLNDLEKLRSYEGKECTSIEPGALIWTDQILFFVGVATPKFHLRDHQLLIGISEDSPIYKEFKDSQVGDFIHIDGKSLKIKSIQ